MSIWMYACALLFNLETIPMLNTDVCEGEDEKE